MARGYSTDQIVTALHETNGMIYLAARRLGCTPQTIYNRAKQTKAIQQAIDDSRGEMVDLAEQKMRIAVLAGEPWAVALVLKTLGKRRGYVERQELSGPDGGPIQQQAQVTIYIPDNGRDHSDQAAA